MNRMLRAYRYNLVYGVLNLLGPFLAPVISFLARTGAGNSASLRSGALPLPFHYYSPVPDIEDLTKKDVWSHRSSLRGIDLRVRAQLSLIRKPDKEFGQECDWSHEPTEDPFGIYSDLPNFNYSCAPVAHAMLWSFKPKRVIEIGSGKSFKVIAAALELKRRENRNDLAEHTVIDPFPRPPVSNKLTGAKKLRRERDELIPVDVFKRLGANDIESALRGEKIRRKTLYINGNFEAR